MKYMNNDRLTDALTTIRSWAAAILALTLAACTNQQFYQGLKAARQANCLEYPESEYQDCVDDTGTGYNEYTDQRRQVISE